MGSRRPGVWSELGLGLALVTLGVILLNGGMMWIIVRQRAAEQDTDAAVLTADSVASDLERGGPARYAEILGGPSNAKLALFDREGRPVPPTLAAAASDAGFRRALLGREQQIEERDGRIFVYTPVPRDRIPSAVLEVSLPAGLHGVTASSLGPLLAYTFFTSAIVAAFAGAVLRRVIVRPLEELRAVTARIADGQFGSTVEIDAAHEFQDLAGSLSRLSQALAEYRADTERKVRALEEANREIKAAQETIVRSERLATVGQLAAGIAHELGNPLAAVSGYVDILGMTDTDPLTHEELVTRARREVDRMGRIIRQLLDFARPGPGEPVTVDVATAIEEARETIVPIQRLKGITVNVSLPSEPARVHIEPDRLHQVLVNLLLNAGDAVDGRADRSVALIVRTDEQIAIACEDNGPGFSPEALQRAMEPFFTTKDVGAGTGLGLAVSSQLIRAAGGTLTIGNRPEGGARVEIKLPRV